MLGAPLAIFSVLLPDAPVSTDDAIAGNRLSLRLEGPRPPGGDGRNGRTGEDPARNGAMPAALIGAEGGSLLNGPRGRPVVGDDGACGLLGSEGPVIKGDPVFSDGELLYREGVPEESADDLNGCTREGRRMGTPPEAEGSSLKR